jgi:hypothetical protein
MQSVYKLLSTPTGSATQPPLIKTHDNIYRDDQAESSPTLWQRCEHKS